MPAIEQFTSVKFSSHPVIETLAERIREEQINWEKLQTLPAVMKARQYTRMNMGTFAGLLLEVHIAGLLEDVASAQPDLVQLNPIPDGERAGEYVFRKGMLPYNLEVRDPTQRPYCEYDDFFWINQDDGSKLPIIIEAKLSNAKAALRQSALKRNGEPIHRNTSLYYVLRQPHFQRILKPLQAYAAEHPEHDIYECGFMVVTCLDAISERSSGQATFRSEYGGQLVPIPVNDQEFRDKAEDVYHGYSSELSIALQRLAAKYPRRF